MKMDVKAHLSAFVKKYNSDHQSDPIQSVDMLQLPDVTLETDDIRVMMISETVPQEPSDYFYSRKPDAAFMSTTIPILCDAGFAVETIDDIIARGNYVTTASKTPKEGCDVPTDVIKNQLPILEEELRLFPKLEVIMLMGDVAKKAVNLIARKQTKKSVIPSGATYRLRAKEYYFGTVRVIPSYIITGGNILIEKSKVRMIHEDLMTVRRILSESEKDKL